MYYVFIEYVTVCIEFNIIYICIKHTLSAYTLYVYPTFTDNIYLSHMQAEEGEDTMGIERVRTAEERDYATIGACLAALLSNTPSHSTTAALTTTTASGDNINDSSTYSHVPAIGLEGEEEEDLGPLILRVHNVRAVAEACRVFTRLTSSSSYTYSTKDSGSSNNSSSG